MLQSKTIYCIYQSKLYCHYFNIHRTLHTHFAVLLTLILAPLTFFCEAPLSVYYAHYSLLFSTLISNASDEKQALDRKTSNYTTCKQQITNTTDVNKKRKKREGERERERVECELAMTHSRPLAPCSFSVPQAMTHCGKPHSSSRLCPSPDPTSTNFHPFHSSTASIAGIRSAWT